MTLDDGFNLNGCPVIPYNGEYIIFSPFRRKIITTLENPKNDSQLISYLESKNFFGKENDFVDFGTGHCGLSLYPAGFCNLKCVYCYANSSGSQKYMNWSTAKVAIDYYYRNLNDKPSFTFHGGGEPTLNPNLIKKCVDYITNQKNTEQYDGLFKIVTNGTAPSYFMNWLIEHNFSISVSADGPAEIHNIQRPFINGKSSYEIVTSTIKLLVDSEVPFGVSSTVSDESVEKMEDIVKHFYNLGVKNLRIEPLTECGRCETTRVKAPTMKSYVHNWIKCLDLAKEYKMKLLHPAYDAIFSPRKRFCAITNQKSFAISHDGYISSCAEVTTKDDPLSQLFIVGNVDIERETLNFSRDGTIQKRNVDDILECQNCFAKYICAGGCLSRHIRRTGTHLKLDKDECYAMKEIISDAIIRIYKESKESKICE